MVSFRLTVVVGALMTLVHPAPGFGQSAGSVTVAVRDSSGAAIPGATVRIINEDTAAVVEGVTDAEGVSRAQGMAAGRYRVEAVLDGFETAEQRMAAVTSGETAAIELTLTPSRVTESVIVTARRIEETIQ